MVGAACLALTGCDVLFGVEPRAVADAAAGDAATGRADAVIEIDAGIDGAAAIDTDGDGVFDDVDNCPAVANPTQHDEDNDSRGDGCDLCPHSTLNGTDSDGDGAGDACDPVPCQAGATMLFDAFDDDTAAPWTPSGFWVFPTTPHDRVEISGDTATLFGPTVGRNGMVELDIDYQFGGNGMSDDYLFGVVVDSDGVSVDAGITCGLLLANGGSVQTLKVWRGGQEVASNQVIDTLQPGRYRVRLSAGEPDGPNKVTCALTSQALGQVAFLRTDVGARGPGDRVAIRTESLGGYLHSLVAITSGDAPIMCP